MRSKPLCHVTNGGLRRSPTVRRAAAAARTSLIRREGWSVRRSWMGIMLKGCWSNRGGGGGG